MVLWMQKYLFHGYTDFAFSRSADAVFLILSLLSCCSVGSPRTKKIASVVQNPSATDLDLKTMSTDSSDAQRLNCLSWLHRDKGLLGFFPVLSEITCAHIILVADMWLRYCRYGGKHRTINHCYWCLAKEVPLPFFKT